MGFPFKRKGSSPNNAGSDGGVFDKFDNYFSNQDGELLQIANTTPSGAASGGTVVEGSGWRMHVFKSPGTLVANENVAMYITCVGGGGGGGCNSYDENRAASGGGGGGFNSPTSIRSLASGTTYPVLIGAGGPGPVNNPTSSVTNNPYAPGPSSVQTNINGGGGGTSRFGVGTPHDYQAGGGGGGGAHNAYPGPNTGGGPSTNFTGGSPAPSIATAPSYPTVSNLQSPTSQFGSGGGGNHGPTPIGEGGPLGNDGGAVGDYPHGAGGGGGGAGSVGGDAPSGTVAGAGGAGAALAVIPTPISASLLDPISVGESGLFAGGGGGKGSSAGGAGGSGGGGAGGAGGAAIGPPINTVAGTAGEANTGGGGGGNQKTTGGAGGSGVVIAYYPF